MASQPSANLLVTSWADLHDINGLHIILGQIVGVSPGAMPCRIDTNHIYLGTNKLDDEKPLDERRQCYGKERPNVLTVNPECRIGFESLAHDPGKCAWFGALRQGYHRSLTYVDGGVVIRVMEIDGGSIQPFDNTDIVAPRTAHEFCG